MIQELTIKNFLSFKEDVTLSFEATKDKTFEDYQVVKMPDGTRLLRFAMVYGANASGKSNLLEALEFLRFFWFAKTQDIEKPTGAIPFLLDKQTPNQSSEFSLKFYVEGVKYWYQLSLNRNIVLMEKLSYYKSIQPAMIFFREHKDGKAIIKMNPAVLKLDDVTMKELGLRCLPNMSVFAARSQVNLSAPSIDKVRDWLGKAIMPLVKPKTDMFDYARRKIYDESDLREYLINFLRSADFNVTGVKTDETEINIPESMMDFIIHSNISLEDKKQIKEKGTINEFETFFEHTVHNERGEEVYKMDSAFQSDGTRRTLGIEAALYKTLHQNGFLFIDELEASLHPDLVELILREFLNKHSHSQLLITTHYDPLLNTVDDLIRKDSVWFTEKQESGNTDLYSLVEFKGLNKLSSIQRAYRNGVFGAIPNIRF